MSDPWHHVSLAKRTPHPALSHVATDHSAAFAVDVGKRFGLEIVRWWEETLFEVQAKKEELSCHTPPEARSSLVSQIRASSMDDMSTGFCLWKTHIWSLLG